ncbi:hypothetical protein MNB_SUP05-SYMBIONT-4-873 [hydrothermal vent metagenome]|uniref:Uncharacterized protein n=1 Tax=hydrothermal vent metagenome TaxID=652676 RepID=A0A1W1DVP4_9ZZZZ
MYQDAFYGPDCKLRVYSVEKPMKSVVLEAQQNLCALEAGSIHVKQISASRPSLKAKYTTKEGSYSEELPGKVIFSGF